MTDDSRWYQICQLLTPLERKAIECALRLASEQYCKDARACDADGQPRLVKGFHEQARLADRILDRVEL